jgi:ABC-type branched-subunit amino acid transport system permease subunit
MTTLDPRAGPGLVAVAVLGTAPLWARTSVLRTLIGFFTLLALATMWNLLAGYAGLVSIGQQAWIGVGAYGLYWLSDSAGLDPFAARTGVSLFPVRRRLELPPAPPPAPAPAPGGSP